MTISGCFGKLRRSRLATLVWYAPQPGFDTYCSQGLSQFTLSSHDMPAKARSALPSRYSDSPDQIYDQESPWTWLRSHVSIPRGVAQSMSMQARHVFLHNAVVFTPDSSIMSRGYFANLADLLRIPSSDALRAAMDAVALSLLATRFEIPEARPLTVKQYALSICHLRS